MLNSAAYEWIQHEPVGRECGLTTSQLTAIREAPTNSVATSSYGGVLNPLQAAALAFTDESTTDIRVSEEVFNTLKQELRAVGCGNGSKEDVDGLLVEAMLVVASYNMVSRFLVGLDVGGATARPVPSPVEA